MHYFVGWDVGGWNCERNPASRDALAVLVHQDDRLQLLGQVFRGNLRRDINEHDELLKIVNARCKTEIGPDDHITIAIDTPLGLPIAIAALVTGHAIPCAMPDYYGENRYLYRQTERWLFSKGFPPLSAIKDMIGSQATKGMHLIRKLGLKPSPDRCGVWTSGNITAIETYPTPCKRPGCSAVKLFSTLRDESLLNHDDKIDAVYCALIAYLFADEPNSLIGPVDSPPATEGWIWVPVDAVTPN